MRTSITSPIANSNLQFVPCLGCLTTSKCRNFFDLQLIYCHALYTCSAANLVRCKLSSAIMKLLCFRTLDLRLTSTSSGISESHSKAFVLQPHTVSVLLGCFGFLVCGEAYEPKTTIASSVLLFSNLGLHYGSVILAKFDDVSILPLLWNSEYKKLRTNNTQVYHKLSERASTLFQHRPKIEISGIKIVFPKGVYLTLYKLAPNTAKLIETYT